MHRASTTEEVLEAVDAWHEGDSELPLHEFLGWTKEEYNRWVLYNLLPDERLWP